MHSYNRFTLMVLSSTLVMFVLMYFNTYEFDHIYFSETRAYMAVMMGAAMAMVMMLFMWNMYTNKVLNSVILVVSGVIFCTSIWLVRSQHTIDDVSWMRAMIPHHSIAILTSTRANIADPRVKILAEGIVRNQKEEILQMQNLLNTMERTDVSNLAVSN